MGANEIRAEISKLEERLESLKADRRRIEKTDWTKEAQKTFNLIFRDKFKASGDWIDRVHKIGRDKDIVTNVLGGVRHLYGYMHVEKRVWSQMDRRGVNSVVQGPSSNLGFVAAYFARKLVWDLYGSRGINLGDIQCNAVHDSLECQCDVVNIPIFDYLMHHAATTLIHRWARATFDLKFVVGLEQDSEVGWVLSDMRKTPRWDIQVEAIEHALKQGNAELDWRLDVGAYMKRVKHNAKIVSEIRRKEIQQQLDDGERVASQMFVTRKNALKLGLIFDAPSEPKKDDGKRRAIARELAS